MAKGRLFSIMEDELIIDNFDKTVYELEQILAKKGYIRSAKSISRRIEKMREEGLVGMRSADTVARAYKQRVKKKDKPETFRTSRRSSWDSDDNSNNDWDSDD